MLSGATWSAAAIAGTAVFRMVVSSDSIKTAMATNHGRSRLTESLGVDNCCGNGSSLQEVLSHRNRTIHQPRKLTRFENRAEFLCKLIRLIGQRQIGGDQL